MRRFFTVSVLLAWLLATGAQWDLLQGFAWGRMIASYSRTMPLNEAVRLTFTPENLCGLCKVVAEVRTRADADHGAGDKTPADIVAKAKAPIARAPEHAFVFQVLPAPSWPMENLLPDACARPAPPTEPPRAA